MNRTVVRATGLSAATAVAVTAVMFAVRQDADPTRAVTMGIAGLIALALGTLLTGAAQRLARR